MRENIFFKENNDGGFDLQSIRMFWGWDYTKTEEAKAAEKEEAKAVEKSPFVQLSEDDKKYNIKQINKHKPCIKLW